MTKAATKTEDSEVRKSKRGFYVALIDLSWRLLAAVLVPIFIGLFIDSKRGGEFFAYAGFIVGIISGALVMRSVVRKLAVNNV